MYFCPLARSRKPLWSQSLLVCCTAPLANSATLLRTGDVTGSSTEVTDRLLRLLVRENRRATVHPGNAKRYVSL